jgi:hypothetical protein
MRLRGLIIIVVLVLGWWFWGRTLAPVRVIRAQIHAMDVRDFPLAYSYLSTDAKAALSLDQFTAQVLKNSVIQEPLNSTFFSRTIENDRASIKGTLEGMDGQLCDLAYILVKEEDDWKILSFQWSPARLAMD